MVLTVYSIVFIAVAFVFQWIDFGKIMKKDGQRYTVFVFFISVLITTFCIGTLFLIIMNLNYLA